MKNKTIGYTWLKDNFSISPILIENECFVSPIALIKKGDNKIFYPSSYSTKTNKPVEHILFALKHEFLNIPCLQSVFKQSGIKKQIEHAIATFKLSHDSLHI